MMKKNEMPPDVIVLKVSLSHEVRKLVWMPTAPMYIDQSKKMLVYQCASKPSKPSNRRRKRKTPMDHLSAFRMCHFKKLFLFKETDLKESK